MAKRNLIWVAVVLGLATAGRAAETDYPHEPGQIIVMMASSTTMSQAEALANAYGMRVRRAMRRPGMFVFILNNTSGPQVRAETQERLDQLRRHPQVRKATLNFHIEPLQIPNDPLFGDLDSEQWNLFQIGLPGATGAWATSKGRPGILVSNLDTDFDTNHPDFRDVAGDLRFVGSYNANNGLTNVLPPYDPVPPNPFCIGFSHGTMTASAIVAGTDNGIGMAGVAWEGVKCVPVRIMNDLGFLLGELIFDGYQYVIDWNNNPLNTKILAQNMSYGALFGPDPIEDELLRIIANQGTLPIAAAGNSRPFFPAGYPASLPQVISVAATRYVSPALEKGFVTSYSSFGLPDRSRKVDLAAPSADTAPVWTLWYGGYYDNVCPGGTSYACPTVVGAVALLASAGMERSTIFENLKATAVVRPGDPVPNVDTGWGEIAVEAAMGLVTPGIKGYEPDDRSEYEYQTIHVLFRMFQIRTSGPAPVVTIEKTDGSYGPVVIDPANYTLTPDANDSRVVWLEGDIRFVDGAGSGNGTWKVVVTGTEVAPSTTVHTGERIVIIEHHVLLAGTSMISIPYDLGGVSSPPGGRKPESFFDPGFVQHRWIPDVDPLGNPTGSYARYDPAGPNTQDAGFTPLSAEIIRTTQAGATVIETPQHGPWGVGLWVTTPTDTTFDFELGPEERVNHYRIKLKRAFNQFGNAFHYFVDWPTCQIIQIPSGRTYTIDQAAALRIIKPQLFRYQIVGPGDIKDYRWYSPPNGQLHPFESHWVYANEECWLQVNPIPGTFRAGASRGETGSPTVRGNGWLVQLRAASGESTDSANYFGMTKDLNENADRVAEAPGRPAGIALWFRGAAGGPSLAQDLREVSPAREVWRFTVSPNKPNADVTISWRDVVQSRKRLRMSLLDETAGRTLSMRNRSAYTFRADDNMAPRSFTLTVQPELAGRLVIGGVRVSGGTRGGSGFSIQYSLSSEATVSVRVLGRNGKTVAQLDSGARSPGTAQVTWNGRDARGVSVAPGVYILQITAETSGGERARTTTPITVTR